METWLIDADHPGVESRLSEGRGNERINKVFFCNTDAHSSWIATWSPPADVVVCDTTPESVDLAILCWRASPAGDPVAQGHFGVRTNEDPGLEALFRIAHVPAPSPQDPPVAGMRLAPDLTACSDASEWIGALAGDRAAQVFNKAQVDGCPWWAVLAHLYRASGVLRRVFPPGCPVDDTGRALRALARSLAMGDRPNGGLPKDFRLPVRPPTPYDQCRAIHAADGCLQVRAECSNGKTMGYDWIPLQTHCPAVVRAMVAKSGGTGPLAATPEKAEGVLGEVYASEVNVLKLASVWLKGKLQSNGRRPLDLPAQAKRTELDAYPSRDAASSPKACRGIRNVVTDWVGRRYSLEDPPAFFALLERCLRRCASDMRSGLLVRNLWLLPIYSGRRWTFEAFLRLPGNSIALCEDPLPEWFDVHGENGTQMLGLGLIARNEGGPLSLALLDGNIRTMPAGQPEHRNIQVRECIHPLVYAVEACQP